MVGRKGWHTLYAFLRHSFLLPPSQFMASFHFRSSVQQNQSFHLVQIRFNASINLTGNASINLTGSAMPNSSPKSSKCTEGISFRGSCFIHIHRSRRWVELSGRGEPCQKTQSLRFGFPNCPLKSLPATFFEVSCRRDPPASVML